MLDVIELSYGISHDTGKFFFSLDLKITDQRMVEIYLARQQLLDKMARNQCHRCVKLNEHYNMVKAQFDLKEKLNQIMYNLSDAALGKMPDFQQRVSEPLS